MSECENKNKKMIIPFLEGGGDVGFSSSQSFETISPASTDSLMK